MVSTYIYQASKVRRHESAKNFNPAKMIEIVKEVILTSVNVIAIWTTNAQTMAADY